MRNFVVFKYSVFQVHERSYILRWSISTPAQSLYTRYPWCNLKKYWIITINTSVKKNTIGNGYWTWVLNDSLTLHIFHRPNKGAKQWGVQRTFSLLISVTRDIITAGTVWWQWTPFLPQLAGCFEFLLGFEVVCMCVCVLKCTHVIFFFSCFRGASQNLIL